MAAQSIKLMSVQEYAELVGLTAQAITFKLRNKATLEGVTTYTKLGHAWVLSIDTGWLRKNT